MARQATDWFEMWVEDRKSILSCMIQNMNDDLKAGYDPTGNSIRKQVREIDAFQNKFDEQMQHLRELDEKQCNRWCYVDLKRLGAID